MSHDPSHNAYMPSEDWQSHDQEIADWMATRAADEEFQRDWAEEQYLREQAEEEEEAENDE